MAFPDRLHDVERLIEQHRCLEHQTLLLTVYYDRPQDPESVYLLEVISQFGYDEISDDKALFQMAYGSTDGFPLPVGSRLNITLTNTNELSAAVEQGWPSVQPLLAAVTAGKTHYQVIHSSRIGDELLAMLQRLVPA